MMKGVGHIMRLSAINTQLRQRSFSAKSAARPSPPAKVVSKRERKCLRPKEAKMAQRAKNV